MKAIIEFNLDDSDDSHSYYQMNKASDMASALWEMMYNTKKSLEYEIEDFDDKDKKEMNAYDMLDKVYERFWEILQEHDISVDKINR